MKLTSFTPALSRYVAAKAKTYAEATISNPKQHKDAVKVAKQCYIDGVTDVLTYIKDSFDLERLITEFPNFIFREDENKVNLPLACNCHNFGKHQTDPGDSQFSLYLHSNECLLYTDICLAASDIAIEGNKPIGIILYELSAYGLGEVLELCSHAKSQSMNMVLHSPIYAVELSESGWEIFEKNVRLLYNQYGVRDFYIDDLDDMSFGDYGSDTPDGGKILLQKINDLFKEIGANVTLYSLFDDEKVASSKNITDVFHIPSAEHIVDELKILSEGYLEAESSLPKSSFKHIDAEDIQKIVDQRF